MRVPPAPATPAGPLVSSVPSITVTAGQSAAFDLAFAPVPQAQNQTYTFSCANLPVGAACSFTPATIKVTSSGATVHATVSTTRSSDLAYGSSHHLLAWAVLLAGMLLAGDTRKLSLRRRQKWVFTALLMLLLAFLLACNASRGSGGNNNGNQNDPVPTASSTTPASTYPILVHATSGSLESSTIVNLTVQ
jgi:hypothetical protein